MVRDSALPDAQEVLVAQEGVACETYLFEPSAGETRLGWLFAAIQTRDQNGIGAELIDTVATAIQREYYRDPKRNPATSFELALHQANLILHDMAEQGMREWMVDFHASVAALSGEHLHISVAGDGQVLLTRKNVLTDISVGLAQSPITDPLQTFSQVASGTLVPRDTLYVVGTPLTAIVQESEIKRLSLESSASAVASRLTQQVKDMGRGASLPAVVVMLATQYGSKTAPASGKAGAAGVSRDVNRQHLIPRAPLIIHHGTWQRFLSITKKGFIAAYQFSREKIWPQVKQGSKHGSRAILKVSRATGQNLRQAASNSEKIKFKLPDPKQVSTSAVRGTAGAIYSVQTWYANLPKSSRIFGTISLVLLLLLGGSLLLLQQKRASDAAIQQASETLQDARAKSEAAKTALIYDNREQAQGLLSEAEALAHTLQEENIYVEESHQLLADIQEQRDRLQRITRAESGSVRTVGDFSSQINKNPQRIFFVDNNLYTYHPENNSIVRMTLEGGSETVHQTSQGIGFFTDGIVHTPDKTIVLLTNPAGTALFDTKDNTLANQEITFASTKPNIADGAVFGNRLYVIDRSLNNIISYNKTLRGYSSGTPWITDQNFPTQSMVNLAIDGNVYTLHEDGSIRMLFKGVSEEFAQEAVSPTIPATARITTSDALKNIYIIDPDNKRIVIYQKNGKLLRQLVVDIATTFTDAAISPDETKAYVLDGTRVLEVSLTE